MGRVDDVVVHGKGQVLAHLSRTPTFISQLALAMWRAGAIATATFSPGSATAYTAGVKPSLVG
jgi:hypothetical protein